MKELLKIIKNSRNICKTLRNKKIAQKNLLQFYKANIYFAFKNALSFMVYRHFTFDKTSLIPIIFKNYKRKT